MATVVLFSREEDTLADIAAWLSRRGIRVIWLSVQDWAHHRNVLSAATGEVIDEVDHEFWRLDSVADLEEWLVESPAAPPAVFLKADADYGLERRFGDRLKDRVHHFSQPLDFNLFLPSAGELSPSRMN